MNYHQSFSFDDHINIAKKVLVKSTEEKIFKVLTFVNAYHFELVSNIKIN